LPLFIDLLNLRRGFEYQTFVNNLEILITYKINFNDMVLYLDEINTSIDINGSTPRNIFSNLDFEKIKISKNITWIRYNNTNENIDKDLIMKILNAIRTLSKSTVFYILTFNNMLLFNEDALDYYEIKEHINTPNFLNYIASNINDIQIFDEDLVNFLNVKRL